MCGDNSLKLGLELLHCWSLEQSFSEFTNIKRDVRHVVIFLTPALELLLKNNSAFVKAVLHPRKCMRIWVVPRILDI
jgi:hypothetical protein